MSSFSNTEGKTVSRLALSANGLGPRSDRALASCGSESPSNLVHLIFDFNFFLCYKFFWTGGPLKAP